MVNPASRPALKTSYALPRSVTGCVPDKEAVLLAVAQAVEWRDRASAGHCERLALYGISLGMEMGLTRKELWALFRGGYLHDIGKLTIADSILLKPGPLTPEEWDTMRTHPAMGEKICGSVESLEPALPIIRSHHEKWDGSGYPDGLRGTEIPLLARILQVADIYDALTSTRPYKRSYSQEEALRIMELETERGWRDPEIMDLLLRTRSDLVTGLATHLNYDGVRVSLHELARHLDG